MAEILLEPSSLSKIIPLSFDLNDTNASNAAQLMTKRQFNTADTDAWFQVTLDGFSETAGSFDITLFNLNDKSVFNHTGKPFTTNPFYYKLDSESDETTNEIRHAGRWIGQIVVTLANGDSATRKFIFDIEGHILDGADVQTILLEDYNALIATINTSKDLLAQYNVDYAALLVDLAAAETARTATYNQLVADQQANIDAFDVALDDGIVAANLATKLQDFEATNNSRLLSAEQQLADINVTKAEESDLLATGHRIDELVIGSGNANAEVTDAHVSVPKNKTFTTLSNRINEIETDVKENIFYAKNIIGNSAFLDSVGWSGVGGVLSTLNGALIVTGSGTGATMAARCVTDIDCVVGDEIFIKAKLKLNKVTNISGISLRVDGSVAGTGIKLEHKTISDNTYVTLYAIKTIGADFSGKIRLQFAISTLDSGAINSTYGLAIEKPIAINVTRDFDSSIDPSVSMMRHFLSKYTDEWFPAVGIKFANVKDLLSDSKEREELLSTKVTEIVDDSATDIVYTGSWVAGTGYAKHYAGTRHLSNAKGNRITYTFTGIGIEIFDTTSNNRGGYDVYIDGICYGNYNRHTETELKQQLGFYIHDLAEGTHTLELVTSASPDYSQSFPLYYISFDYFKVIRGKQTTVQSILNKKTGLPLTMWLGTQMEYEAIPLKDDDTIYLIGG